MVNKNVKKLITIFYHNSSIIYIYNSYICKHILQYKPTKFTFSNLVLQFLIFAVFYMFRARWFIIRKTAVYVEDKKNQKLKY